MQRTLNLVSIEESVAQSRVPMRTDVVSRVDLFSYPIQCNFKAAGLGGDDIVLGHRNERYEFCPLSSHVAPQIG
jgi:hypothetical protein